MQISFFYCAKKYHYPRSRHLGKSREGVRTPRRNFFLCKSFGISVSASRTFFRHLGEFLLSPIVKLRNAVKICDKITFCTARFSWIKVRHSTDNNFKRVGFFRRMTYLAKSRRNSGGQSSDITVPLKEYQ